MMRQHRRFIIVFMIPIVLMLIPGIANVLFLYGAGELYDAPTIARRQQQTGAMYGTAVHRNIYSYKLSLLAERKPEVVVIGSSRVLTFRQRYFRKPFVNLGLTVGYPSEVLHLAKDMVEIWRPKLVILGIDFWWGSDRFIHAFTFNDRQVLGGDLTPRAILAPANWLLDGKILWPQYLEIIKSGPPVRSGGRDMYGVQAITIGKGFGPDGSHYYSGTIFGRRAPEDPGFRDTLGRISSGTSQFRHAGAMLDSRVAELREAIAYFKENGIEVITFLPPLAPRVLDEIQRQGSLYGYLEPFRSAVSDVAPQHFDFLDSRVLDSGECEFVDGFHGGEITTARILARMADNTETSLSTYVDRAQISADIERYTGHAQADQRYRLSGEREIDFLGLGCKKNAGGAG